MNATGIDARPHVLIVDDEPSFREALSELFSLEGFVTTVAVNGQDASQRLLLTRAPDVILLDLEMPIMDGAGFCAWLRCQAPELAHVPVVVLSASDRLPELAAALRPEEFLAKPVLPDTLLDAVRRVLARKADERGPSSPAQ